jgi:hypothetical protein
MVEKRITARKAVIERTIVPQSIPPEAVKQVAENPTPQLPPPAHASLPPKPGTVTETKPSAGSTTISMEKTSQPSDPLAAIRAKRFKEDEKLHDFERVSPARTIKFIVLTRTLAKADIFVAGVTFRFT